MSSRILRISSSILLATVLVFSGHLQTEPTSASARCLDGECDAATVQCHWGSSPEVNAESAEDACNEEDCSDTCYNSHQNQESSCYAWWDYGWSTACGEGTSVGTVPGQGETWCSTGLCGCGPYGY
jgi:hypothetical protein